jgi:hypothetical protein
MVETVVEASVDASIDASFEEREQAGVEVVVPRWRLPDPDSIAEEALSIALEYCARKTGVDSRRALMNLRQGDRSTCSYHHYDLAKAVARSLGALDEHVRAVYVVDYDATPDDLCFGESNGDPLIHLIVWARRRTGALDALLVALDRALAESYGALVGLPRLTNLLDVQVVDDTDVNERVGYGALLSSVHHQPVVIWERQERIRRERS